jgi:hypothetical protein
VSEAGELTERVAYTDSVTDPFGRTSEFARTEYRQVGIEALSDFPELLLINQSRGTHLLASRLSEVNDFNLTISPLKVDVLDWSRRLQRLLGVRGTITMLHLADVELERGVTGIIAVRGVHDVRGALAKIVAGKKYVLDKVQIRLAMQPETTLTLFASGAARTDDDAPGDIAVALRSGLQGLFT